MQSRYARALQRLRAELGEIERLQRELESPLARTMCLAPNRSASSAWKS